MEITDPELIQKWIRQQIIFDRATITYRDLAEEASCGIDRARQLLEEFCGSEDGQRLKVEPTYLIFGTDKRVVGDCTAISKVESARASELEDLKSKFLSVSCVQIRSISATQAPDPNLLRSYTDPRISLKPQSRSTTESTHKESKGVDPEPKKESKSDTGSKKNEPEKVKKPDRSQSKTNKRRDSGDTQATKTDTSESSQSKLNPAQATKSPKDKLQKTDTDAEAVAKVASKRSASEVDNRKNLTAKKLDAGPEHPKTAAKDSSAQVGDATTASAPAANQGSAERKRVTKTRIVKKKKIVRVKDKKGYRVNREEIEEVEETYTDWESAEELESKKKKAKTTHTNPPDEPEKTDTSSSLPVPRPASDLASKKKLPAAPPPPKKNPPIVKQSKEQSNITSFFKKA